MQLSVGQNVVHPMHGTGEITQIKKMDLVEGFNRYYEVEFFEKKLTLNIPVRTIDDSGIRTVMSEEKLDRVFDTLRREPDELPEHYKERRKKIEDLLKTGRPEKIAQVVRELTWQQEKSDGLNTVDSRMLSKSREMLIAEIAMVTDSDIFEAQELIDAALARAMAQKAQVQH